MPEQLEPRDEAAPAPAGPPIRVLVVDDSYLVREGLRLLLELSDAVEVIGGFADAEQALVSIARDTPDVVIADIRMPPTYTDEGIRLADQMRREYPSCGVVVLSQESTVGFAARLLQQGASGRAYLSKDRVHDVDHLVSAISAVHAGDCRIDPILVQQLVTTGTTPAPSALDGLTPRQRELLADIAQGKSNMAIARDRFLSQRAVEKHVSEIFTRLGLSGDAAVSRRVRATLLYLEAARG